MHIEAAERGSGVTVQVVFQHKVQRVLSAESLTVVIITKTQFINQTTIDITSNTQREAPVFPKPWVGAIKIETGKATEPAEEIKPITTTTRHNVKG